MVERLVPVETVREVVREVPVEKQVVVEKEVIREVPVEKIVEVREDYRSGARPRSRLSRNLFRQK